MSKWKSKIDAMLQQRSDIELGLTPASLIDRTIDKRIDIDLNHALLSEGRRLIHLDLIRRGIAQSHTDEDSHMDYKLKNNRRTI